MKTGMTAKEQRATTLAARVVQVALTDVLGAKDGEPLRDAFQRAMDERIEARLIAARKQLRQGSRWWKVWA